MYNNIFKTAVIDCDVSHRFIKSVTHPLSFPCQGCVFPALSKGRVRVGLPINKGTRAISSILS